jgi:hypothetical protein
MVPTVDAAAPLTPREVAALLRSAAEMIRAEISLAPRAIVTRHPGPREWCMLEVLGHLIESEERGFAGRIRLILAEDGRRLEGWDQEAVARARRDCAREPASLLADFSALRAAGAALVERFEPADLERRGEHPTVGTLRVRDLLHEWVHHDRNHIAQMLAAVQAAAWPHMGNAQRFSLA